jgi:hypothetical protein
MGLRQLSLEERRRSDTHQVDAAMLFVIRITVGAGKRR